MWVLCNEQDHGKHCVLECLERHTHTHTYTHTHTDTHRHKQAHAHALARTHTFLTSMTCRWRLVQCGITRGWVSFIYIGLHATALPGRRRRAYFKTNSLSACSKIWWELYDCPFSSLSLFFISLCPVSLWGPHPTWQPVLNLSLYRYVCQATPYSQ